MQCNLDQTKGWDTVTCKNIPMEARLKSGIEENLYAVRIILPHSVGREYNGKEAYGQD